MQINSSIKTIVVVGTQWGDEGKGKIVDLLTNQMNLICRFQGGHNAGHTLIKDNVKTVLHLIPSGILHSGVDCIIGNGVVVSGEKLLSEIQNLENKQIKVKGRLYISKDCPLILNFHKSIDLVRETKRGKEAIGTTGNGIGPAYEDKIARRGIRIIDLENIKELENKFKSLAEYHNFQLKHYYHQKPLSSANEWENLLKIREQLLAISADTVEMLQKAHDKNKRILLEGAQGSLLDIDHGSYPFVTSSNTLSGAATVGSGLAPKQIDSILGLAKAYTTRVGRGPFPTELSSETDKIGKHLSAVGSEVGATTGRPRRCGWLDLVLLRRTTKINGITSLCISKIDVLDGIKELKICVAYKIGDEIFESMPLNAQILDKVQPIYETLPGWQKNTKGITEREKLPTNAQKYVDFISKNINIPISILSTGAERNETVFFSDIL